jgi:hypothetical protein
MVKKGSDRGVSVPELAEQFDKAKQFMYGALWACGIEPSIKEPPGPKGGPPRRLLTPDQVKAFRAELKANGVVV